jgi:molybdate transport system substrate-binding protein
MLSKGLKKSLVIALLLGSTSAFANEVKVAVAANFYSVLQKLAVPFEAETGHQLKISSGPTGKLKAQIANGAPFDVFLAADVKSPAALEKEGLIKPGSRFTYSFGRLALWSPSALDAQDARKQLESVDFRYLAIANPKAAPYGVAAVSVLEKLGLYQAYQRGHLVMGENIGQTYQFVATGNAQAGMVAYSYVKDAKHKGTGAYWLIPADWHAPLEQQAVITQKGAKNAGAQALMAYLRSPAAKQLIETYGYSVH